MAVVVQVFQDLWIVGKVLFVDLDNDTRCLEHVPGVIDASAQIRFLSASPSGGCLIVIALGCTWSLFLGRSGQVALVHIRFILWWVALATQPLWLLIKCISQVHIHHNSCHLRVRHEFLILNNFDDLFGDALESRGFLGRTVDFGLIKLISFGRIRNVVAWVTSFISTLVGVATWTIELELSLEIGISKFLLGGGKWIKLTRLLIWCMHLTGEAPSLIRRLCSHYSRVLLRALTLAWAGVGF